MNSNGRTLLIGDPIKVSKEAQRMPGADTQRQNLENSGKPKSIPGHGTYPADIPSEQVAKSALQAEFSAAGKGPAC